MDISLSTRNTLFFECSFLKTAGLEASSWNQYVFLSSFHFNTMCFETWINSIILQYHKHFHANFYLNIFFKSFYVPEAGLLVMYTGCHALKGVLT